MVLKEIIAKIRELKQRREEENELSDDVTRDKYLRSLRRERRIQMEEVEKERLKKTIANYQKNRMRKLLFGIKKDIKVQQLMAVKKKKGLSAGSSRKQESFWFDRHKL